MTNKKIVSISNNSIFSSAAYHICQWLIQAIHIYKTHLFPPVDQSSIIISD